MKKEIKTEFTLAEIDDILELVFGERFDIEVKKKVFRKGSKPQYYFVSKSFHNTELSYTGNRIPFIIAQAHNLGLKMVEVNKEEFAKKQGRIGLTALEGSLDAIKDMDKESKK